MITRNTDYSIQHLRGLSTDTKPTDVPNGSEFREMDTGKKFLYSAAGTEWIEQPCCGGGSGGGGSVEPLKVAITQSGTNGFAMDKTSTVVYNAFISGTPIVYTRDGGNQKTHPVMVGVRYSNLGDRYTFMLSFINDTSETPTYKRFSVQGDNFPATYDK